MKQEVMTYKDLIEIYEKLNSAEYRSWNNLVEMVYVDYLIGIIEGSSDEYEKTTMDMDSYKKSLQFFKRDIDDSLEEAIDLIHINYVEDLEEDVIIEPCNILGEGWFWHKYDDGSGSLVSPDGKEYMLYDLQTNEYKETIDSSYDFFPLNYYYMDGVEPENFDPFNYMEKVMIDRVLSKESEEVCL